MAAIFDEDVRWGEKQGLGPFIAMWQGLTSVFDDCFFGMTSARVVQVLTDAVRGRREIVMEADTTTAVCLSELSAHYLFPDRTGVANLLHLVLGRTVRSPGRLRVVFDLDTRRITRLDVYANMEDALLPVVKELLILKDVPEDPALVPEYVDDLPSNQLEEELSSEATHVTGVPSERGVESSLVPIPTGTTAPPSSRMSLDYILTEDPTEEEEEIDEGLAAINLLGVVAIKLGRDPQ